MNCFFIEFNVVVDVVSRVDVDVDDDDDDDDIDDDVFILFKNKFELVAFLARMSFFLVIS